MDDIILRKAGRTGRITLNRPDALNALTRDMIRAISEQLPIWADDDDVTMLIIDAVGEKAFCAGGDLTDLYDAMVAGNLDIPRAFWREEYAMNAALFAFPKPVASFLQGYTMGGGVGVGCHASHRVVCETSKIALPECSIGLVPDVGSSLILARAPGRLGEYLGVTGARADAELALSAGVADYFIPHDEWRALISALETDGDWNRIDEAASVAPTSPNVPDVAELNEVFGGETLRDIWRNLTESDTGFAATCRENMVHNSPLAMACAVELIHRARARDNMAEALRNEYRFVHRVCAQGDFQEGIRAAIIDKDRAPKWAHNDPLAPTLADISAMLRPLGTEDLTTENLA